MITALSRDVAQSGSAPEWGSGGPEFKSPRPDHSFQVKREGWLSGEPSLFFVLLLSYPIANFHHPNKDEKMHFF